MEEKELWMNKLKEKLEDYSEPIPASGWEQLEKELMPPVERKIYPYRKWMMAAAAVTSYANPCIGFRTGRIACGATAGCARCNGRSCVASYAKDR